MRCEREFSTLVESLQYYRRHHPRHVAIISRHAQLTYEALADRSHAVARVLVESGVTKNDRVAFLGKEVPDYYVVFYACSMIGAVFVPINWKLSGQEINYILVDSKAKVLFCGEGVKQSVFAQQPSTLIAINSDVARQGAIPNIDQLLSDDLSPLFATVNSEDTVVQLYTSGTTGNPKGVELAHRSFFAIGEALHRNNLKWLDWRLGDKSLVGIPGFHVGGLWWAVQGFNSGVSNVIVETFVAQDILNIIEKTGVTIACMVPAMLQLLLLEEGGNKGALRSLRKIVYGGSPISEALLTQAMNRIGCEFSQIYGLTETGNTAICLPPEDHQLTSKKLKSAGKPYPGVEVKIIDTNGCPVLDGEVGEICLSSPASMKGYANNVSATSKTLVDGWLHTGDAGYLDEGYLYICDRIKDMIIVGGENIYPNEIEKLLHAHPAVDDVAVIGVPDARWGEKVCAIIQVCPGVDMVKPRELSLFLRAQIADFKVPQQYEFVDSIPRNPSGKILRRRLREKYWVGHERFVG